MRIKTLRAHDRRRVRQVRRVMLKPGEAKGRPSDAPGDAEPGARDVNLLPGVSRSPTLQTRLDSGPGRPPRSAHGDSGVTSVKVRPHKKHNSLSTFIFSYINAQFAHHYARKGSVVGRSGPSRNGADKKEVRILQLSRHKSKGVWYC